MRNRLAWIGGAVGGAALLGRELSRRRKTSPPQEADSRAEELRRKLDESRTLVQDPDEFQAAETPVDAAEPAPPLAERRRQVHERGRRAVDRMRGET